MDDLSQASDSLGKTLKSATQRSVSLEARNASLKDPRPYSTI